MKKILFFNVAIIITMFIGCSVISCGPSQKEIARQDSIRAAENQRIADSIKTADSIARAEEKAQMIRQKINEFTTSHKSDFAVPFYNLNKVAYVSQNGFTDIKKIITIIDFATGDSQTISLSGSEIVAYVVEVTKEGESSITVSCHNGGSGPFYSYWQIDVNRGVVTKEWGD